MEITVTPKKWYVVSGAAGSTISTPEGVVIATVPDGGQASFFATTYTVEASDDSTEVVEATFKYAPAKLWALGVFGRGETLPIGYLPALFIESTGTQNIKLTDTVDRDTGLMATYQTGEGQRWTSLGYFCTENVSAIALPYRGDWSESDAAKWYWRWYTYTYTDINMAVDYQPDYYTKPLTGAVNWKVSKAVDIQFDGTSFHKGKTWYDSFVETYTGLTLCARSYKTYSVKVSQAQNVTRDLVPSIAPTGEPCLYDKVTRQPFYNSGTGSFVVGMTAKQARKLGKLPDGGGTLTISLPSEVVDENGVLQDMAIFTALSAAAAKGWTFILQTHDGTAVETAVPAGYMECEFLESTGEQWINTGIVPQCGDELKLENVTLEFGTLFSSTNKGDDPKFTLIRSQSSIFYKYFASGASPAFKAALLPEGSTVFCDSKGEVFVNNASVISNYGKGVTTVPLSIFGASTRAKIGCCVLSRAGEMQVDYVPCIAPDGKLGMYNKVDGTVNAGGGAFICGMTAAQAVQLANLPTGGGELTVSLPQSILNDAGEITGAAVRAALNKAADNGWDITLQYYTES